MVEERRGELRWRNKTATSRGFKTNDRRVQSSPAKNRVEQNTFPLGASERRPISLYRATPLDDVEQGQSRSPPPCRSLRATTSAGRRRRRRRRHAALRAKRRRTFTPPRRRPRGSSYRQFTSSSSSSPWRVLSLRGRSRRTSPWRLTSRNGRVASRVSKFRHFRSSLLSLPVLPHLLTASLKPAGETPCYHHQTAVLLFLPLLFAPLNHRSGRPG